MKPSRLQPVEPAAPADTDGVSLPAWIYRDAEFFERERQAIFRNSWQLVCHLSDVPLPGDFHTFEFYGESVVVLRAEDGALRAFHNVCRHRASRLLDGPRGHCGRRITCPYHAWTYALDGRLVSVPQRESFAGLDTARHGLAPLEHEVFMGFIFVRFAPGLPSVRDMAAPYAHELAPYRLEELVPLGRVTLRPRAVNWKNVADNYSDGLHINVAHPGLTRLFGKGYGIEARPWIDKMWGTLRDTPSANWSERLYQRLLPALTALPPERQRLWTYFKLWPNLAFDIYPDQIDFMQFLPVSPTETLIREIAYVHPDARREMRAVRYLNWRINRRVSLEDKALIERVQAGMASSSYTSGPLSEGEVCLRSFARRMRALIPQSVLPRAPARGWSHG
jgi:phenylpropionate dioxygenase-like ring-hydroxylating dioxygenase large terminal subunit